MDDREPVRTMTAMLRTLLRTLAAAASALLPAVAAAAGTVTYFHNDLAGSPVVATDASGQVLWRESYRPYGERLVNAPAASGNTVWFTSRRQDAETGLVYMGARYYDPVAGRFVSPDPVGFEEPNLHSFNRYAYANNNPYRYKDPDGRAAETILDVVSFGISLEMFRRDPSVGNFLGAAVDGIAVAVPFLPGGVGSIRAVTRAADSANASSDLARSAGLLPDSAVVCRGGSCTAERFMSGSGVTLDSAGKLQGVSVNSGVGKSLEELTVGIPNRQVGVSTVGDIRRAGGDVVASPTASNPNHCTMCGITPNQAERLMTPTKRNPHQ
jgi:RHS repeat-associated protein